MGKENNVDLTNCVPDNFPFERDAVHIATMMCICGEILEPGEFVKIAFETKNTIKSSRNNPETSIGIISPWIKKHHFKKGDRVWVMLTPGSITGLRHDWTHHELDTPVKVISDAEAWLRKFADEWNFDYDDMISIAKSGDDYIVANGTDIHSAGELGGDYEIFWTKIEELTGLKYDSVHRKSVGWSCSC